jgi:hypothetical protein
LVARVHSFEERLAWSRSMSGKVWWGECYRRFFLDDGFTMQTVEADGWAQRAGIDRIVTLSSGRAYTIDEKVREFEYHDVLLELLSNEARRTPGWAAKDLACDFIAYGVAPTGRCHLFPFPTLRRAVQVLLPRWQADARCRIVRAPNPTYTTLSIAVPTDMLLDAIRDACSVTMPPMGQPVGRADLVSDNEMHRLSAEPGEQLPLFRPGG